MPLPAIRFLSLFVPDLAAATARYEAIFGVSPTPAAAGGAAPRPHPYAAAGPVVFDLGGLELALYQCDGRTTHPGDVGIGVVGTPAEIAARGRRHGARVMLGPERLAGGDPAMAVMMLPERHFFEVVAPRDPERTSA